MKSLCALTLLCILSIHPEALAQETAWGKWTLQPRISIGKLLPGSSIDSRFTDFFPVTDQTYVPGVTRYQYAGTGIGFGIRAFPEKTPWLAIVLEGGITWFYRPGASPIYDIAVPAADGVGTQLAPKDFTVYPLALGVQCTYPSKGRRDFMLFVGAEGTANFVSGDIPMDQSVKPGLGLTAGFAVKLIELGIRYETFSDLQNLGVFVAFRLNPFEVDFAPAEPER